MLQLERGSKAAGTMEQFCIEALQVHHRVCNPNYKVWLCLARHCLHYLLPWGHRLQEQGLLQRKWERRNEVTMRIVMRYMCA